MINNFNIKVDLGKRAHWNILMPRYNVAPTDQIPVIFNKGVQRYVRPMRWGLIPESVCRECVFEPQAIIE